MSLTGALRCACCGQEESTSGCARGHHCGCLGKPRCRLCDKCEEHHHQNCTPELREEVNRIWADAYLQIHELRKTSKINVFEYGKVKDE